MSEDSINYRALLRLERKTFAAYRSDVEPVLRAAERLERARDLDIDGDTGVMDEWAEALKSFSSAVAAYKACQEAGKEKA